MPKEFYVDHFLSTTFSPKDSIFELEKKIMKKKEKNAGPLTCIIFHFFCQSLFLEKF